MLSGQIVQLKKTQIDFQSFAKRHADNTSLAAAPKARSAISCTSSRSRARLVASCTARERELPTALHAAAAAAVAAVVAVAAAVEEASERPQSGRRLQSSLQMIEVTIATTIVNAAAEIGRAKMGISFGRV